MEGRGRFFSFLVLSGSFCRVHGFGPSVWGPFGFWGFGAQGVDSQLSSASRRGFVH